MTLNLFTVDKLFHSFNLPFVLKLTGSQTKTFVLLVNQEGHDNNNNIIPGTNLSVKLDVHFIRSLTREIQIHYFSSCMANSPKTFKVLCAKLSSSLKYIKVQMALHLLICLYGFIL